jgi:hypothetical protein
MRKNVFTIHRNVLMAFVAAMLMLALSPVTAMAADGETPSAAVADERVAWARQQTVTQVNTLDAERGGSTDASVGYFQDFVSSYTGVARTFEYRLVPLDEANPMPLNSENGIYAWTFEGDDSGWINIDFSGVYVPEGEQVFYYAAFQHIPEPEEGYTYDDRVYYVDVHVLANGQGVVANVRNSTLAGEKVDDPGWTVKYEHPQDDDDKPGDDDDKPGDDSGDDSGSGKDTSGKDNTDNTATTTRTTQSGTYSSTSTPSGSSTTSSGTTGGSSSPKTGDTTNYALAILLFVSALIAFVAGMHVRFAKGDGRRG